MIIYLFMYKFLFSLELINFPLCLAKRLSLIHSQLFTRSVHLPSISHSLVSALLCQWLIPRPSASLSSWTSLCPHPKHSLDHSPVCFFSSKFFLFFVFHSLFWWISKASQDMIHKASLSENVFMLLLHQIDNLGVCVEFQVENHFSSGF